MASVWNNPVSGHISVESTGLYHVSVVLKGFPKSMCAHWSHCHEGFSCSDAWHPKSQQMFSSSFFTPKQCLFVTFMLTTTTIVYLRTFFVNVTLNLYKLENVLWFFKYSFCFELHLLNFTVVWNLICLPLKSWKVINTAIQQRQYFPERGKKINKLFTEMFLFCFLSCVW